MAAAETLTQLQWTPDLVAQLQPSVDASPWGGLDGPQTVLAQAHLFEHRHANERALIVARPVRCDYGMRCDIVGLRSDGDRLTGAALNRSVMRIAREGYNAELLAMTTKRQHVANVAMRTGWVQTGFVLIKPTRLQ